MAATPGGSVTGPEYREAPVKGSMYADGACTTGATELEELRYLEAPGEESGILLSSI